MAHNTADIPRRRDNKGQCRAARTRRALSRSMGQRTIVSIKCHMNTLLQLQVYSQWISTTAASATASLTTPRHTNFTLEREGRIHNQPSSLRVALRAVVATIRGAEDSSQAAAPISEETATET